MILPLKKNWKIDEDSSIHPIDQIRERCRSEDNYTNCKGYPLIKEVEGFAGNPKEELIYE